MYKPTYGQRYYTITKSGIIANFMWLDLDDDEEIYKKGLVFKTEAEAQEVLHAASGFDQREIVLPAVSND